MIKFKIKEAREKLGLSQVDLAVVYKKECLELMRGFPVGLNGRFEAIEVLEAAWPPHRKQR